MSAFVCMSLMCLGGRRLFATDHLYPSPPGASHHLHHTSHSIRLKVGHAHTNTHEWLPTPQLLRLITSPFWPPAECHPTPAHPAPPACPILPQFASPLLPCSRALLPLSFPGSGLAVCDEWDNITLVLCWPGLTAPTHLPHLSVCLSVCPSPSPCLRWLKTFATAQSKSGFICFGHSPRWGYSTYL